MTRTVFAALFVFLAVSSCKAHPTQATDPFEGATATPAKLLSGESPAGDEDPSVLQLANGSTLVAWFSNRGGNADIYLTSSTDRVTWTPARRITTSTHGDFYPNLLQDSQGLLHLVWFEWVSPFLGQIRHASSTDGIVWTEPDAVTTEFLSDDWVPTIAESPDGTLLVYFVASKRLPLNGTNDIFLVARRPGQIAWEPPVRLSINSPTAHDHLPFAARTGPNEVTLVWSRFVGDSDFIANPRSDLYTATSADGRTWASPRLVTTDRKGQNLFAQLYRRHDGSWRLLWLTTKSGSPQSYEAPLAELTNYPQLAMRYTLLPPGYSHRIAAAGSAGEYLATWVQGAKGVEDIYYRMITLPNGR